MANVRDSALRSLRDYLDKMIDPLRGRVVLQDSDATRSVAPFSSKARELPEPMLAIDRGRFAYAVTQAEERYSPSPDRVVIDVGTHEGVVTLKLVSKNENVRGNLEQLILDLFLVQELAPGVLLTQVDEIPALGEFTCAWELENETWRDEYLFDKPKESVLEITARIPALVTRRAFTIEQLQVAFTEDFDSAFDETVATSDSVELIQINEDGTHTLVP